MTDAPRDAAPSDGPADAAPDGWVGTSCTSVRPWCDGAYCLAIPALPPRRAIDVSRFSEGYRARAPGAAGEAWFATSAPNTLGHVTATGGLEMVVLPGDAWYPVDGLAAASANDIDACNSGLQAWHYDGQQWSALTDWTTDLECYALWAAGPGDVWKMGYGTLSRWSNGTWTPYPTNAEVYALDGSSPSNVWFGGQTGYVAHFDGTQYQVLVDASADGDVPDVHDVHVLGPDDVAVGRNRIINGTLMSSVQLGYPATPDVTWGTSDDFWIAATDVSSATGRTLWHDAGGTWTQYPSAGGLVWIDGTGPDDVWFIWDHSISHWNGQTLDDCASWGSPAAQGGRLRGLTADYSDLWMLEGTQLARSVNGADFVIDTNPNGTRGFDARPGAGVFAVAGFDDGNPGVTPIARHFDGTTWTDLPCAATPGADQLLLAAKAFAANDAWFAGDAGTVFHWDGTTCTLVPHPLASTTYSVIDGTGPNDVWFFGATATLHWDGQSLSRYAQTIPASDAFAAGTSLWIVGGGDVQEWNGTTWTSHGSGSSIGSAPQIWASSSTDVWVVSTNGASVAHFDGSTWTDEPPSPALHAGTYTGIGIWGSGTAGDFMMARGGTVLHHQ